MNDLMKNDVQYWQVTIAPEQTWEGIINPALTALQFVSGGNLPQFGLSAQKVTAFLNKEQLMTIAERPGIASVKLVPDGLRLR